MRKFLSLFFVALLVFQVLGSLVSFRVMRETARRNSRRQVEQAALESLEKLVFSKAAFGGIVFHSNDEFVWHGEHYDAKEILHQGEMVVVYAKHDKHETRVVKKFVAWFGDQLENMPTKGKSAITKVFLPEFYWHKQNLLSFFQVTIFSFKKEYGMAASFASCCPSPPPDITSVA